MSPIGWKCNCSPRSPVIRIVLIGRRCRRETSNERIQEKVYPLLRHGHHYAIEVAEQVAAGLSSITSPYQPFGKVGHDRPQLGNVAERFGDLFKRSKTVQHPELRQRYGHLRFVVLILIIPFGSLQVDFCCILAGENLLQPALC